VNCFTPASSRMHAGVLGKWKVAGTEREEEGFKQQGTEETEWDRDGRFDSGIEKGNGEWRKWARLRKSEFHPRGGLTGFWDSAG